MATVKDPIISEKPIPHSNGAACAHFGLPFLKAETSDASETALNNSEPVRPPFKLEEHPIDEVRPMKVGVIGAGLAGVTAGILLPAKLPGLDLRVWDKNTDVVRPSRPSKITKY